MVLSYSIIVSNFSRVILKAYFLTLKLLADHFDSYMNLFEIRAKNFKTMKHLLNFFVSVYTFNIKSVKNILSYFSQLKIKKLNRTKITSYFRTVGTLSNSSDNALLKSCIFIIL